MTAAGCVRNADRQTTKNENPVHSKLIATVTQVGESDVSGSVSFTKVEEGILVRGNFEGLEPGNHGFHIHEFGDCSSEDATSAGGHFNPGNNEHASPTSLERHMGDLGNLQADENGIANAEFIDASLSLDKILGRGIIIHASEDDFETQPTGDAGSRVACGVIGIAQVQ